MEKSTSETIIKVIAVLGYIGAAFLALIGLAMAIGANMMGEYMMNMMPNYAYSGLIGSMIIVIGAVFIGLAVLSFFVSKGLWDHKEWARIVSLIFAGLGAVIALFSLPFGIVSLAINAFMIWFFGFDKTTKGLFK